MIVEKVLKAQLGLSTSPEKAIGANFVCPQCGGPAETETFWSTSPDRPGLQILKRQTFCGKRPRRGFRKRPNTTCPVVVEEIGTQNLDARCEARQRSEPVYQEAPNARKLLLSLVKLEVQPPSGGEVFPMSSNTPREDPMESTEGSALGRGRLPAELRNQILEMSANGMAQEEIALRVGRSPAAVRKVLASEEVPGENLLELDGVIDFLSSLPEEAIQEVMQLARLQRERSQLRSSLEIRLKDMKKVR